MTAKKKNNQPSSVVDIIARAAEEKQAIDIKILDISKTDSMVDFLIFCSAESEPQIRALEKEIDKSLRNANIKGFRWQGQAKSGWIVLDFGDVLLHIMGTAERDYYNLEELWEKDAIIYHY